MVCDNHGIDVVTCRLCRENPCKGIGEAQPDNQSASNELLVCPFCGGETLIDAEVESMAGTYLHTVVCYCGAEGPGEQTQAEAIHAWNRRANVARVRGGGWTPAAHGIIENHDRCPILCTLWL